MKKLIFLLPLAFLIGCSQSNDPSSPIETSSTPIVESPSSKEEQSITDSSTIDDKTDYEESTIDNSVDPSNSTEEYIESPSEESSVEIESSDESIDEESDTHIALPPVDVD